MKTPKTNIAEKVAKPKVKLSVLELVMKNIPNGKYKGLDAILSPHEIPQPKHK